MLNERLVGRGLPDKGESVAGGVAREISNLLIGQPYGQLVPPRERDFADKRRKIDDTIIEHKQPGWEELLMKKRFFQTK